MHCRSLRMVALSFSLGTIALWPSVALGASGLSGFSAADSFLTDHVLRESNDPATSARSPEFEECRPTGPIETTLCDYESLERLVEMPFFKYFMVDLYRECPFWDDQSKCDEPGCAIEGVNQEEIPDKWKAATLSKIDGAKTEDTHHLTGCYYRDSDFCLLDDNTEGDYYDLISCHEAHRVWSAIYDENCFGLSESTYAQLARNPSLGISEVKASQLEGSNENEMCLEKKVYYKVISGLHASISTHICAEHLNQRTGEWGPNLSCFLNRLSPSKYPERIPNIYFNTVLLLRAVARISPFLKMYDYCSSGTHEEDAATLAVLDKVVQVAQSTGRFDENGLFKGVDAEILKEEFKDHFRNVTRIMDCVGCAKCQLWGKVQTTGVATALKILFELDDSALDPTRNHELLQRSELVALFNTLHRFSESLHAINTFQEMMRRPEAEHLQEEESTTAQACFSTSAPGSLRDRANKLFSICRESTTACVETLLNLWFKGIKAMKGLLKPSNKQFGPGAADL
ncbi:endoplasmic reticulum Oxidoreductin 1-domain-containing protein [Flagelloscypha sp. PMI_526]|nr:endoplasmic reticulum Oxidoreductin 1-domain-containing protein [Flagelloscypha sp. PMI_526]